VLSAVVALFTIDSMSWRHGGDYKGYELALGSDLFLHGSEDNRIKDGNGWVVTERNDSIGYWAVAYVYRDAVRSMEFSTRFTRCRRILATENVWHGVNPLR
jgi:hypothetical protein